MNHMNLPACEIRISDTQYRELHRHLFPGDRDEHGAVLRAGLCQEGDIVRLLVRDVIPAQFGSDYVKSHIGYRALTPQFIHKQITSCRDERLVYLAVHNHDSDQEVAFSQVDLHSHERGYPALLDIAKGMPVGALVLGKNAMQADLWMPSGERRSLSTCTIVGKSIKRLRPARIQVNGSSPMHDRQMRMFGKAGQVILQQSKIAVIGLGGVGSIVAEYLARLGVGHVVLVDDDHMEVSNLSRVVGATTEDAISERVKTEVAKRHILEAAPNIQVETITEDTAKESVATRLRMCDYIFLAADSMRARLLFNALVHQYLIPGTQMGAKVRGEPDGSILDAMSAIRHVRPGQGCLWCNGFIEPTQLAMEVKTEEERRAQAYGTQEPNPSVITMNAVAAAHAVNDFLFDFLGLRLEERQTEYLHIHHANPAIKHVRARHDEHCRECGRDNRSRFARGDSIALPTLGT
jgi:hypothetical protein